MRATLLLCDWAEVVAGKLYAQGIGWTTIRADTPNVGTAVAVLLYVPYDMTNRQTSVRCKLFTADGGPYPAPEQAEFGFDFEIGRPPGLKPGTEQIVPFAAKVIGLGFAVGEYEWKVEVNGSNLASASFAALGG